MKGLGISVNMVFVKKINMSKLKLVLEAIVEKGYTINKEGIIKNPNGKELTGSVYDGYRKVSVRTEFTSSFAVRVHKFQAYVKYGDLIFDKGVVVRHLDGNSLNNSYQNIVIGSQSENMMDRLPEERKNQLNSCSKISRGFEWITRLSFK